MFEDNFMVIKHIILTLGLLLVVLVTNGGLVGYTQSTPMSPYAHLKPKPPEVQMIKNKETGVLEVVKAPEKTAVQKAITPILTAHPLSIPSKQFILASDQAVRELFTQDLSTEQRLFLQKSGFKVRMAKNLDDLFMGMKQFSDLYPEGPTEDIKAWLNDLHQLRHEPTIIHLEKMQMLGFLTSIVKLVIEKKIKQYNEKADPEPFVDLYKTAVNPLTSDETIDKQAFAVFLHNLKQGLKQKKSVAFYVTGQPHVFIYERLNQPYTPYQIRALLLHEIGHRFDDAGPLKKVPMQAFSEDPRFITTVFEDLKANTHHLPIVVENDRIRIVASDQHIKDQPFQDPAWLAYFIPGHAQDKVKFSELFAELFVAHVISQPAYYDRNLLSQFKNTHALMTTLPLVGESKPASTTGYQDQWQSYLLPIQKCIRQHWMPPKSEVDYVIISVFDITRQGRLGQTQLKQKSAVLSDNQAALQAIKACDPYPTFPNTASENKITVEFTFDYRHVLDQQKPSSLSLPQP